MNTSRAEIDSRPLAGTVEIARLRVAAAEAQWKAAKERSRVAKRQRKEAKLVARRARNEAKQSKADLLEARKALAEAEGQLAQSDLPGESPQEGPSLPVPAQAESQDNKDKGLKS